MFCKKTLYEQESSRSRRLLVGQKLQAHAVKRRFLLRYFFWTKSKLLSSYKKIYIVILYSYLIRNL